MLLLLATSLFIAQASAADFYVSPKGVDGGSGTRHHPFQTLERAKLAVRTYRHDHPDAAAPVVVHLTKGIYRLAKPFELTPEDSGTKISPTVIRGDHATISGGRRLTGFKSDSHGYWTLTIPEVRNGSWNFSQLFVNGQRRYRPRFSKDAYFQISKEVAPSPVSVGHGYDRFGYRAGDLNPKWHNLSDVELLCFHTWDMSRMRIGSINETDHVVTTTGPTGYDAGWANFPAGNRYIVENVREALGKPGDWYLDRQSGELTYVPMPGETPENTTVEAPFASGLISIKGDIKAHQFVEDINFVGITFEETNWNVPAQGRFFPQAEVDLSGAIRAEGWRYGRLEKCSVAHTGEYGVDFGAGCAYVTVQTCRLIDLGAGGIKIGETGMHDDESDCANHISVENCLIAHGGRLHPAAIGVWIGQSAHDTVSNNEIADLYYTGVSIGWTWGYSKSQAFDNLISNNDIHDIGQGVLSDMGGIYTLGVEPGTKLVGNRIHDIDSFSYGGWGIYPDEGSSHELIEHNIVYRTKSGGFHQHYGQENIVQNNLFAFAKDAQIIRTRAEDHLSFTFSHNIVLWKDAPLLGSNWSGSQYKLDSNLYWRTDGKPVDFAGQTVTQWQAKGQDIHSKIADPEFVNWAKGDFRLKAGSPAFGLGISLGIPTAVGPRNPWVRKDQPAPSAFPLFHFL